MVILSFTLQSIHFNLPMNLFQIQTPLQSNKLTKMKFTNHRNYSTHITMMIFWMFTYIWSLKFYSVSTELFHKYGGENISVTNSISHFYIFIPIKVTMKLANINMGHAQGIGIILCFFPNCIIIYPTGTVYYCPGHPSNTISSGDLKFYIGFKKVTSEPL